MSQKRILVTNDDGIESPGLKAAAEAALPLGTVRVVAPAKQGTSMGRCLRGNLEDYLHQVPFEVSGTEIEAFYVDASPALAVKHGLDILFPEEPPDLIISGINYGENLGIHITHSGTVGAAIQGAGRGCPAIAASLQSSLDNHYNYGEMNWEAAIFHTRFFVEKMLNRKMPLDVEVLKIDVPETATSETEWRFSTLSKQPYYVKKQTNPTLESKIGDAKLSISIDYETLESDSDIYAFAVDKIISVTPLSLDLTSRVSLSDLIKVINK